MARSALLLQKLQEGRVQVGTELPGADCSLGRAETVMLALERYQ